MSEQELVTLEFDGPVAIVRLNDPTSINALSHPMIEQLQLVLDQVERQARSMILTGAGNGFCSGANLKGGFATNKVDPADIDCGAGLEVSINPLASRLRGLSIPWITAVRGVAAGGGTALALAGDMVISADNARYILVFARIGLIPDCGIFHILVHTIGRVRANELMLLGGQLTAQEALAAGLVNHVVPEGELDGKALEIAHKLAQGAASIKAMRNLSWQALDATWQDMLWSERMAQRDAGRTADFGEGVAAFLEKRPPQFTGQ